ncbi:MAG: hypothetical protein KC636_31285, partial [Myxococcales bacterium]|nr:hypothetical protein [Myxococcales bacterium]
PEPEPEPERAPIFPRSRTPLPRPRPLEVGPLADKLKLAQRRRGRQPGATPIFKAPPKPGVARASGPKTVDLDSVEEIEEIESVEAPTQAQRKAPPPPPPRRRPDDPTKK